MNNSVLSLNDKYKIIILLSFISNKSKYIIPLLILIYLNELK